MQRNYDTAITTLLKSYALDATNENVLLNLIDAYTSTHNLERADFFQSQLIAVKKKKNERAQ